MPVGEIHSSTRAFAITIPTFIVNRSDRLWRRTRRFPRYESIGRRVLRGKERTDIYIYINVALSEVRRCRVFYFAARKYLRYLRKKTLQVATLDINAWSPMRAIYLNYIWKLNRSIIISYVCLKKKNISSLHFAFSSFRANILLTHYLHMNLNYKIKWITRKSAREKTVLR